MNQWQKVFIIDDEVDICLLMKTYFLRKNYDVCIAHSIEDALPRVTQCQPDIIFLATDVCQNPEQDLKRLKRVVPKAEIIVNNFQNLNRF